MQPGMPGQRILSYGDKSKKTISAHENDHGTQASQTASTDVEES